MKPNLTAVRKRRTPRAQVDVVESVQRALVNRFKDKDVSRVAESFTNTIKGNVYEVNQDNQLHQRATSYVSGLDSSPFVDDFTGDLQWVSYLEGNWEAIAEELARVTAEEGIEEKGTNIWAPPVVDAANAYGPDWRTLVLKDRIWDPVNTKLFPETTRILQDKKAQIPAVEAFFARQSPKTGIKLHTDDCNFIMTMHMGLSVPDGSSWIEVGGERRYWENGKGIVFNTSYFHQTMNESEQMDRNVLLIRFWHPQLTAVERKALSFLFDVIDDPEYHPAVIRATEELRKEAGSGRRVRPSGGKGFGAQ